MKNKVILTDCDGVILDWLYAFDQWMARHGYTVVEEGQYDMDLNLVTRIPNNKPGATGEFGGIGFIARDKQDNLYIWRRTSDVIDIYSSQY